MVAVSAAAVTGFAIALTAGAYSLSLLARKRHPSPLTTPVLFSTAGDRHKKEGEMPDKERSCSLEPG